MKRSKQPAQPNYLADILKMAQTVQPGTYQDVYVYHDDWCALLKGKGSCNCNPEVERIKRE